MFDYQLTRVKLGRMAAVIQASRQFSYHVATLMAKGEGATEASMVKAYVCKAAEWVTREAMQIHGGMGYAEEYAVSRLFVDARVLSIFEGADGTWKEWSRRVKAWELSVEPRACEARTIRVELSSGRSLEGMRGADAYGRRSERALTREWLGSASRYSP